MVRGKEKTLCEKRKMLGERRDLVDQHLNDVHVNMHERYARENSPSAAAIDYRSELEKQSLTLWKQEFDLKEERRLIDSRKQTAQRQLDELNRFRIDLHTKKT